MPILFWSLFAIVAWCYLGYPLVMGVRARVRTLPRARAEWTPRVSVVLAVRNEANRIASRVDNLLAQDYPSDLVEIIVVCNGCSDDTEASVSAIEGGQTSIRVLISPAEGGKAEALNRGVAAARGEVLIFADARQRFEPDVFRRLTAWLADPEVGAVSGRLVIGEARSSAVQGVKRYWQIEVALRRAESDTGSVVGATGAIYAIRTELFEPLPVGLILDDVLIPMRIAMAGLRVGFEYDAVATDTATAGSKAEFRRKVRTMVGNLQILRVEPRLLSPGQNPLFFRYVSHKILRLVAPICLIGMLVSGAFAGGIYLWLVLAQAGFYALGVLGLVFPLRGLGIPAGFLLTHAAVLVALFRPASGAEALWGAAR